MRVASVPANHVYVQHLSDPGGADGVQRLADPAPAGAEPGQWWPPAMLEAGWVREHRHATLGPLPPMPCSLRPK